MPFLIQYLCTTHTTPWGIITSIFVHRDLNHFMSNMISLLLYTALFIFTNMNLSEHEKKRRSVFFLRVVFLSATLANVGWIIVAPNIFSAGSSGAVYASLGIMFGFSLINSICLSKSSSHTLTEYTSALPKATPSVTRIPS